MATLTTPSFATTIGVGGATPSASGAGITFPATQSASTDANTLDDYEEGTFTPTLRGGSSEPTVTYTIRSGSYVKIGRQVTVYIKLVLASISGGSGSAYISGLPFIGALDSDETGGSVGLAWQYNANPTTCIQVDSNSANLYLMRSTANVNNQISDIGSNSYIYVSITYTT
jgi:hypothetical protein